MAWGYRKLQAPDSTEPRASASGQQLGDYWELQAASKICPAPVRLPEILRVMQYNSKL